MKTVTLKDLPNVDFVIKEIEVIYQTPEWRVLDNRRTAPPRSLNGFLLITEGSCDYFWDGGEASLGADSLIYLPTGCCRRVTVTSDKISFWRISFHLYDSSDGEELIFREEPFVVTDAAGQALHDICKRLFRTTMAKNEKLTSMAGICEFLSKLRTFGENTERGRIAKAIDYLNSHYSENCDVASLAAMCYLSEVQFYRLFRKKTGKTPIEYRNLLRITRACSLLSSGECSVGEIALMLGFSSLYYFSRVFKQITGKSPTAYLGYSKQKYP